MDICRICLSGSPEKHIYELKISKKERDKCHTEILLFCLNIQLSDELEADEKLCFRCFKKVISFYKFKAMALENNTYLKCIDPYNNVANSEPKLVAETPVESSIDNEIEEFKIKAEPGTYQVDELELNGSNEITISDKIACKYDTDNLSDCDDGVSEDAKSDYSCIDFMDIKSHQLIIHNPDKMPMECGVCHLRFPYQSALDNHMTHHTKEKAFQCENCGKSFRLKMLLNQHVRSVHEKEKNFICQHCSKSFFKKYHYLNHVRTHTKERPFKCDMCEKSFTTTSTLKDHQYLHSTVKQFHCKLCAMSFAKAGYLRKHMLSHSKEKNYACKYCGVCFKRSSPRKKHEYDKHEKNMILDHVDILNVNNNNAIIL